MTWTLTRCAACAALLSLSPVAVSAQQDATRPPNAPPATLVVQQVQHGWLAAPDVKFARIAGRDSALVGGYGGWVNDRTWLVGAGGYWLANGRNGTELGYGGLVLEWLARTDRRFGFGARTLIGGGNATVPISSGRVLRPDPVAAQGDIRFGVKHHGHGQALPPGLYPAEVHWNDTFFIAEPQVNALLNLTRWCRINAGVGYRAVGGASLIDDRVRGVSGTLAVQFGSSK